jgi:hypothetical protein
MLPLRTNLGYFVLCYEYWFILETIQLSLSFLQNLKFLGLARCEGSIQALFLIFEVPSFFMHDLPKHINHLHIL